MRTIRLTNFAFALLCLFLSNSIASGQSPAHNQPTQSQNAYCKAWSSDQATIYFSDVFESDVPSRVILNRGIESLFEAHLKQSYGYSSTPNTPVVCVLSSSEEKKKQELTQYTMMGKELVETRWKMSPQQAAALAVPAALPKPKECYLGHGESGPCSAAAPKPSSYIVCRAVTSVLTQEKRTTYFSDVMPRANVDQAGYSAAFVAFLAKKYGVQGVNPDPSMCPTVPSEAEGHRLVEEGWWKVNPYTSTSVQTG